MNIEITSSMEAEKRKSKVVSKIKFLKKSPKKFGQIWKSSVNTH